MGDTLKERLVMAKKRIKDMEAQLKATVLIEQGYQDQIAELKIEKEAFIAGFKFKDNKIAELEAELDIAIEVIENSGIDYDEATEHLRKGESDGR